MSDNSIKFGGKVYDLSASAAEFVNGLRAAGMADDVIWSALQAAVAAGIVKRADEPKEHVPDYGDLAAPVVARAIKDGPLGKSVRALDRATRELDRLTAERGLGTGFEFSGEYAYGVSLRRDGSEDGVKEVHVKVETGSELAKAAKASIDALRDAETILFAIGRQVAEKAGADSKETIGMGIAWDGNNPTLTFKGSTRKSSRGGGGGGGGKKYTGASENGTVVITYKDGTELARGSKAEDLEKQLKESLPKVGEKYWAGAWKRKSFWPAD